ncbi:MAG: molybdopterin-dependent oxidoreductase [Candidatus Bipolaricaulia bacterium]
MRESVALTLLLALLLPLGCGRRGSEPQQVEIREYQGQKLGSIEDFRENSIKGVQHIDPECYQLVVTGLVEEPRGFRYTELQELPHLKKVVTLHCVEGWEVTALWEGIPLKEIFDRVRPRPEANTVIFYAPDGYSTSLPLSYILEKNIIIADRINGLALPPEQGFPFQLVAESKWGYKWIRWLTRIKLSENPDYRGYSNSGDEGGPIFGD